MEATLQELAESRIDGRATYLRYRQRQVHALYNAISNDEDQFVNAIRADVGKSDFEARLEVTLVLQSLKLAFEQSDFKALTQRVKTLRKGGSLATGHGSVLIIGHWTAPLDTIVSPLSAAIVAGNVALSLLPKCASRLMHLFHERIYPSLDVSAYPVRLNDEESMRSIAGASFDSYVVVSTDKALRREMSLRAAEDNAPIHLVPLSNPDRGNVCIVSKTADRSDLHRIANLVVRSSYGALSGQSLGAMSFVCVHEQIHDDFVKALANAAEQQTAASADRSLPKLKQATHKLANIFDNPVNGKISFRQNAASGEEAYTIIGNVAPQATLLDARPSMLCLPVVPFTSTEEALNIIEPRLGHVLSVFADALEVDYFVTELKPQSACANDLPVELLVGISPVTEVGPKTLRWVPSMFERSIRIYERAKGDADIFAPYTQMNQNEMRKRLLPGYIKQLTLELKAHSNIIRRVFFLQGLFLSLSVILGASVLLGGYGGTRIFRYLRHVFA